ncbi:putative defensin-like protein 233 [Raphanus sativus]|nr:putative defensin-like protein 233 [Raphanus sativus]
MKGTTLVMVSCVFICFVLSHGKDGDCYDQIPFPEKCSKHGDKKCFKDMLSANITRRFLSCNCINREPFKSSENLQTDLHKKEHPGHICNCLRAVPGDCVPDA